MNFFKKYDNILYKRKEKLMKRIIYILTVLVLFLTPFNGTYAETATPAKQQQTLQVTDSINAASLDIVREPKKYLNKTVTMTVTFDKFSTLGLDYKPAMRNSQDYIGFLIKRDDIIEKKNKSIEQLLKQVYDNNVAKNSQLMSTPNGGTIYGTVPSAWKSEEIAHQSFMNAVQEKKERDDIRKVVS